VSLLFPWRKDLAPNHSFAGDILAGAILTIMLIPQSLAYAVLAGMPPHTGLYASIFPLLAYILLGRSPVLAVGPVAIASVMTFDALRTLATPMSPEWIAAAAFMAVCSGLLLLAMGFLRLGFLAQLLSHPVMSGFLSGAALLIIMGQLKGLTGIPMSGGAAPSMIASLFTGLQQVQMGTLQVGLATLALLILLRTKGRLLLCTLGLKSNSLDLSARALPLLAIAFVALALALMGMGGITPLVGPIPEGLPPLSIPEIPPMDLQSLFWSAALISLVGFIESVAMAQALGRKIGVTQVDANAELRGLGAANLAAGFSQAFPVTGGLTRTVVNVEAGARSPIAGIVCASLMVVAMMGAGGLIAILPLASLSALIIVSASTLFDSKTLIASWRFDRADGLSWLMTFIGVLIMGIETGIVLGIALSVLIILWRLSRPHIAVIGRLRGTEHFRNVQRHEVETLPNTRFVRIDANLFFGNWSRVREAIDQTLQTGESAPRHLVLCLTSVSDVDTTALEGLIELQRDLRANGVTLHLSEIKGPLSDKLAGALNEFHVHLSNHAAFEQLAKARLG